MLSLHIWSKTDIVFLIFIMVVYESLVCPEQLNCPLFFRKTPEVLQILWFSSIIKGLNIH